MKTSTLSKKFFKAYQNYFNATEILLNGINYMGFPDIIYPAAFLLRHSAELLIKSLICDYALEQKAVFEEKGIFININSETIKLDGHSLLELYDKLIKVASSSLVILIAKDLKLRNKIKIFDKSDRTGEYYRYPVSKKEPSSKMKMFNLDDSGIAPDLAESINFGLLVGDGNPMILHELDEEVLANISDLNEIINELAVFSSFVNDD